MDFGAFVDIFPGTDGLLHISEIAENRIRDVREELKEGDPDPGEGPGARSWSVPTRHFSETTT